MEGQLCSKNHESSFSLILFDLGYDHSRNRDGPPQMAKGVSDPEKRENSPLATALGLHFREGL